MIRELLSSDLMTRLGWTLLHSLWQLTLLGILLGITLALCSRRSARLRYGAACAGLALMFVPLVVTFTYLPMPSGDVSVSEVPIAVRPVSSVPSAVSHEISFPAIQPFDGNQIADSFPQSSLELSSADSPVPLKNDSSDETEPVSIVSAWMPWIVGFWLIGVCLLGIWNLGGWVIVQRLRSAATMPVSNPVRQRALELAQRMRLTRPVQLVESILIEVPMTIGWLKPMILLPASLVTGLTNSQLDAVLAHELAHIRRHDYLVNLLQSLAESLLFYHPAVWLVSRRIRIEREFCCDDEAIALSGDKAEYVNMLAQIEQNRIVPAHALALLGPHKGLTLERIRRILGISPSRSSGGITAFGSLLLILGVGITVAFAQQQNSNEEPTAPEIVAIESKVDQRSQNRLQAEKPSPEADDPHAKLKATIDPEDFQIELVYRGDSDKPFYRALFTTAEVKSSRPAFSIVESMDRATAAKVYTWLDESGFYKHAVEEASERAIPVPGKPQYLLRISSAAGKRVLVENLGWDLGMLLRLESLRDELAEELPNRDEGSPQPGPLDPLLERLSGFRKSWTEGQPEHDLKSIFTLAGTKFVSGQPIPVKLQLQNVGQQVREYEQHSLSRSGFEIRVFDQFGRPVPYLGGPAQLPAAVRNLKPGETVLLEEFDLAQVYYLRKPGTYFARYLGNNNSRSNRIEFTVSRGDDKELDIVGQLLPLVHGHWVLIGNPNFQGKVRPGSNFEEVEGTSIIFQDIPTGSKRDVSLIWLWFTDEQAKPREQPDDRNHPPASTYLGIFGGKHLYAHRDEKSLERWPTLLDDLHKALGDNVNVSHTQRTQSTFGEAAHESTNSNRSRLATTQQDNPINRLVAKLNASHGLWINGASAVIDLPLDAELKEVLERATKAYSYDEGPIETYKIITTGEVKIEGGSAEKYHAIQIESNRGPKILLCRYDGNYDGNNNWWTRFYDIPDEQAAEREDQWGRPDKDILMRLGARKLNWRLDETPRFELDVRNSSEKDVTFIPHISTCDLECDGVWYVWGAPVAWGGPANIIPSQKLKSSGIDFQLVHDAPQGWVTKDEKEPLHLTEGKHTIRVALRTHEGPNPISNAITIVFGPDKLVPEAGENDPNRAVRAASAPQFEIKPVEHPQPVEEASIGLFHNGGFETPDHYNSLYNVYFPGPLGSWKVERGTVDLITKYWTPAEGKQSLDLSGFQNQPGTISQEIITVPGRIYRIRFSAAANPEPDDMATLKQLKIFWGESESKTLEFDAKGYDFKNVGWKTYEFEAIATGKKTRLAFESLTTSPCGPILDDISVVQISE